MFKPTYWSVALLGVLLLTGVNANAQIVSANTHQIAQNIYSYGPGDEYYSLFIVTDEGVIAIESVNSEHATGMLEAIRSITDQPIRYLIHSHNHWDHASGGQVFMDAGATTIAHIDAARWMAANTGRDMSVPNETWSGSRHDITLGSTTVELHHFGMSHGLGMTVFRLPEQGIVYIADLVTPERLLFTIVPDFNIREWERTLEAVLDLEFDRAVFSHHGGSHEEGLAGGSAQGVVENLQFIRDLRGAIYAEFEKGTPPFAVPSIVELPQYEDWAMYDEWLEMNAWRIMLDDWMGPYPWQQDITEQVE